MSTVMNTMNELIPRTAMVKQVIDETHDVKSFVLEKEDGTPLDALPGQFMEISVRGVGESTFAMSRLHDGGKTFSVSVKRMGHNTKMLQRLSSGEPVGYRGPYGNHFPIDQWQGKDVVIVGGGIGLAPLRPAIDAVLENRKNYKDITVLYGARTPYDIIFKDDLSAWDKDSSLNLITTIDKPHEDWKGTVGLLPEVLKGISINPGNTVAVVCGPPIMIKFTVFALMEMNVSKKDILTTLEMKMQCGIGQCGRCNIGGVLICKDGPVFIVESIPAFAWG